MAMTIIDLLTDKENLVKAKKEFCSGAVSVESCDISNIVNPK
jgi:hypothetical protein